MQVAAITVTPTDLGGDSLRVEVFGDVAEDHVVQALFVNAAASEERRAASAGCRWADGLVVAAALRGGPRTRLIRGAARARGSPLYRIACRRGFCSRAGLGFGVHALLGSRATRCWRPRRVHRWAPTWTTTLACLARDFDGCLRRFVAPGQRVDHVVEVTLSKRDEHRSVLLFHALAQLSNEVFSVEDVGIVVALAT